MSIADAIASLGAQTYSVATPTAGAAAYDVHGRATAPASPVTSSVVGLMTPLNGRDVELLPEGLRGSEVRYFWTKATLAMPLASAFGAASSQGAVLTSSDGEKWVVRGAQAWVPYTRYLLSRLDP